MTNWILAQINIVTAHYPMEDERMNGFIPMLDRVNALADEAPGLIWRLKTESGKPKFAYQAWWWAPRGRIPAPDEGLEKFHILREAGPSLEAFNFKHPFDPPE